MSIVERPEVEQAPDPLEQIPTLPEEPETKRDVFLRAIEIIKQYGWEMGGGIKDGPLCLMEAVALARFGDWKAKGFMDFVYLPESGDAYMGNDRTVSYGHTSDDSVFSCWTWNDNLCKGGEHAISVLQALADGKTWAEATT